MTTRLRRGQRTWSMQRDRDGHREYKIRWLVEADTFDGPADVLTTPGLAIPGDYWVVDADTDLWATCKLDATVAPHPGYTEGEKVQFWIVEQTFSTKGDDKRCKDQQWDDPLLVPDRISGTFSKYQEEAVIDRFGKPIYNSAFELFHGPTIEFDQNRPTIKISQNRAALEIDLFLPMVDTVNDAVLWGLPPRTVKLSNVSWERKFYGQCYVYYERNFEFDIRSPKFGNSADILGFDRVLLDVGGQALNGHWDATSGRWVLDPINGAPPDPNNPAHFIRLYDRQGNPVKKTLDGAGKPVDFAIQGEIDDVMAGMPVTVTTLLPHGLVTGDTVSIEGVIGTDEIDLVNDTWTITVTGASTFTLNGSDIGGIYEEGGIWQLTGSQAGNIVVQKYEESNFLLLGIPLTF